MMGEDSAAAVSSVTGALTADVALPTVRPASTVTAASMAAVVEASMAAGAAFTVEAAVGSTAVAVVDTAVADTGNRKYDGDV
jgi:hypothetical protein